jgi:hypothetical protein
MHRLMQRDAIPADRNSFFFRPVELLGLAAGSAKLAEVDEAPRSWLRELVAKQGALLQGCGVWSAVLGVIAARQLGAQRLITTRLEPRTAIDAAVLLWLHLADEQAATATTSATRDALSGYLLELAGAAQPEAAGGVGESGIVAIALQRAVAAAVRDLKLGGVRPADFVVDLCRRFPLLVAELGHRYGGRPPHEISDEYGVQDLLRGILKLHFDDVRPEEWIQRPVRQANRGEDARRRCALFFWTSARRSSRFHPLGAVGSPTTASASRMITLGRSGKRSSASR